MDVLYKKNTQKSNLIFYGFTHLKLHIEKPQAVLANIAGVYHRLAGDSAYSSVSLGIGA